MSGYEIPSGGKTFAEGDFVFIRRREFDRESTKPRVVQVELPAIAYGYKPHNDQIYVFIPRRKTAEQVHLSDIRHATADDLGGGR